jgi:hypothetical protein
MFIYWIIILSTMTEYAISCHIFVGQCNILFVKLNRAYGHSLAFFSFQVEYSSCNLSCHSGILLHEETVGWQPMTIYIRHNVTLLKMTSSRLLFEQAEGWKYSI